MNKSTSQEMSVVLKLYPIHVKKNRYNLHTIIVNLFIYQLFTT